MEPSIRTMRVYHFTTAKYGLEDLEKQRLKVARILELNDPFEFLAPELSDSAKRKKLQNRKRELNKKFGLLCFSRTWQNPVLWSHYAEKHSGICLGFDIDKKKLHQVHYVNSRTPWHEKFDEAGSFDEPLLEALLCTKFIHWSYEDEYRFYHCLGEPEGEYHYEYFGANIRLREVIIGAESKLKRKEINEALGKLAQGVKVLKARAAFKIFRVVRNKDERRWT